MNSILEGKREEINWDEKLLVIEHNKAKIILTNGGHTDKSFEGTVVWADDQDVFEVGDYISGLTKKYYNKLYGDRIILHN